MTTALLLGAFWGFLEATLGGALHAMSSPISGSLMGPIGFGLLFWGAKRGLTPRHIVVAAFVAAAFKFLDPIIFTMPLTHIRIINPAQAVVSQGLAFAVALFVAARSKSSSPIPMLAFISVPLAMVFFNAISYYVIGYKETGHL